MYRVLVVDDNPAMRKVIGFNLKRAGYSVHSCCDGQEALTATQQESFDAVVTDQEMPKLCGTELIRTLRAMENYADVPIVLLTAKSFELPSEDLQVEHRIAAVLPKPFSPTVLSNMLQELLSGETRTASA